MWISKDEIWALRLSIFDAQKEITELKGKMTAKGDVMITKYQHRPFGGVYRAQYHLNDIVNLILDHLKLSIVKEEKEEIIKLVSSAAGSDVTYSGVWVDGTAQQTNETKKTKKPNKKKK